MRSLGLLALLAALSVTVYASAPGPLVVSLAWSGLVAFAHFRMDRTGKTSLHRTFYFAALALFFLLNMHLSGKTEESVAPYCHLSLAGNLVHIGYNQYLSIVNNVRTIFRKIDNYVYIPNLTALSL